MNEKQTYHKHPAGEVLIESGTYQEEQRKKKEVRKMLDNEKILWVWDAKRRNT